jgi:hypothetical protein
MRTHLRLGAILTILGATLLLLAQCAKPDGSQTVSRNGTVSHRRTKTITLIATLPPKRMIYEDERVRIEIASDDFFAYLQKQLTGASDSWQQEHVARRAVLEQSFQTRDTIPFDSERERGFIADMLIRGKARVFDKQQQAYVPTIRAEVHDDRCGSLCGQGRRLFYFPDGWLLQGHRFFEVLDWQA